MYITLYDVGQVIVFLIILIISGYLIAVLHRVLGVLGNIRGVLDTHGDDIRQIIAELPIAMSNVNELSVSLKTIIDQTNGAFGSLQNNLTDTVDDLRYGLENFVVYVKIVAEVCRAVFSKSG